jgi:hypothetical protein
MSLRAFTATTINEMKDFLAEHNIGKDQIIFQGGNWSGGHDIVYNAGEESASLKAGDTAEDRAIFYEESAARALASSSVTASGGRTLTFDEDAGTITASSGDFTSENFIPGMELVVAGTTSNNGTFLIKTVTATVITIETLRSAAGDHDYALVDEGPLAATATLNANQGWDLDGSDTLQIISQLNDATSTLNYQLWTYDKVSELWSLYTGIGTSGPDNPKRQLITGLAGVDKVAIVTSSPANMTTGYSFWLKTAG